MKYLLFILFFSTILISQTKPIQGSVLDENGDPLFNVNVVSKPSNTGTQSDDKGEFIFEIPIGDRQIILDHIGYEQETLDAILFKNGTSVTLTPKVRVRVLRARLVKVLTSKSNTVSVISTVGTMSCSP